MFLLTKTCPFYLTLFSPLLNKNPSSFSFLSTHCVLRTTSFPSPLSFHFALFSCQATTSHTSQKKLQTMMIMKKQSLFISSFLLLCFLHCSRTLAQAPALAPAPAGPTNVTKILEKAGQFTLFIRLLKSTQVANQLLGQLNNTNNGITIFAPTDNAFSSLKSGTLNSLSDEQKSELVQFHIIPTYLSSSQFQTVSNPLRTQAGDSGDGKFPLNVTTSGNSVNITSGLTNTSVSGTIYTDGQLAVYQIDKVLQPLQIFDPRPPAPAPAPAKSKKKKASSAAESPDTTADNSRAERLAMQNVVFWGVTAIVVALSL